MPELIRLNVPFILILAIGMVAFALAYFFYRKTNPPIPLFARWTLLGLRALVIFSLILLFFKPVLTLIFIKEKTEKFAVFIDNSKSMSIKEGQNSRWEKVQSLSRFLAENLPSQQTHWFVFNTQVKPLPQIDSLRPSQGATNFYNVLSTIRKQKFDRVFIVSDGVVTEGRMPTLKRKLNSQIFTIPVGQARKPFDVFVKDFKTQNTVYKDEPIDSEVIIGTENVAQPVQLLLSVKENNKVLTQKRVTLKKGSGSFRFPLSYRLRRIGMHHLTVEIEPLKNELNTENNRFHFVQEVLKAKQMVGLFTAYPNYDFKFLKLAIQKFPRFTVLTFAENNRGKLLENSGLHLLDSTDVWLFVDFPGTNTSGVLLQRLNQSWKTERQNILLMVGRAFSNQKFQQISTQLPALHLKQKGLPKEQLPVPEITPQAASFVNLFADGALNRQFWNRVPPLLTYHRELQVDHQITELLNTASAGQVLPLVFLLEGSFKMAIINGLQLWRWHFLLQTDDQIAKGYQIFVERLLSWLSQRTPFKPLRLTVDRNSGHLGQTFQIEIQMTDSRLQAVPGGSVILNVKSSGQTFSLPVHKIEEGKFKATFTPVREGHYTLLARGFQQDRLWGADSTQVIIIPVNKELIRLTPDTLFLKRLATFNNGALIPSDSLASIRKILDQPKRLVRQQKEIELWYKIGLLIAILTLISVEWALRKRWNLI